MLSFVHFSLKDITSCSQKFCMILFLNYKLMKLLVVEFISHLEQL